MTFSKSFPLVVALLAGAWLPRTSLAQVIISDTFGSGGDAVALLSGRTPDVGPGSAVWKGLDTGSTATSMVTGNGAAYLGTSQGNNSMAGIELTAGYFNDNPGIYELSATLQLIADSGTGTWMGIGFSEDISTSANRGFYQSGVGNEGEPWMLLRLNGELTVRSNGSNNLIDDQQVFTVADGVTVTHAIKLRIDTSLTNWTVDAYFDGAQLDLNGGAAGNTYTYSSNPTDIAAVGINSSGGNGLSAQVLDFTLTQVPEPGTVMLIGAGLGLMVFRRRMRPKQA